MMRKHKTAIKVCALILTFKIVLTDILYAAPIDQMNIGVSQQQTLLQDPTRLEAPLDFSTLKEIHKSPQSTVDSPQPKLIIHIQDAHSNYSGQQNLAGALDELMKKYKISLVLVEGGTKDDTLTTLKAIAPTDVWKRVAKKFLMEGKIAGEEYLNLTSDHPMKIMGIEDRELYMKSLNAYSELAGKREQILLNLKRVRIGIEKIKNKVYPEELKEYEKVSGVRSQESGVRGFEGGFKRLVALAGHTNRSDLTEFPNVEKLKQIQEQESAIDFNAANLEQAALVEQISKMGGKENLKSALSKVSKSKNSKLSQLNFVETLFRSAKEKNIVLDKYPNLVSYEKYLHEFGGIDFEKFFDEYERLEDEVYRSKLNAVDHGPSTVDALLIRSIDRYLGLLESAYRIQMSTKEFEMFKLNEPDFATTAYLAFINRKLADLGYFDDMIAYESIFEDAKGALENFYQSVSERDEAFMKNTERVLSEDKQEVAILIAGGYHTKHLQKLFKEKGYSYAVLTPHVTSETNQKKYEKVLLEPIEAGHKVIGSQGHKNGSAGRSQRTADRSQRTADRKLTPDSSTLTPDVDGIRAMAALESGARLAEIAKFAQPDQELGARLALGAVAESGSSRVTPIVNAWSASPKKRSDPDEAKRKKRGVKPQPSATTLAPEDLLTISEAGRQAAAQSGDGARLTGAESLGPQQKKLAAEIIDYFSKFSPLDATEKENLLNRIYLEDVFALPDHATQRKMLDVFKFSAYTTSIAAFLIPIIKKWMKPRMTRREFMPYVLAASVLLLLPPAFRQYLLSVMDLPSGRVKNKNIYLPLHVYKKDTISRGFVYVLAHEIAHNMILPYEMILANAYGISATVALSDLRISNPELSLTDVFRREVRINDVHEDGALLADAALRANVNFSEAETAFRMILVDGDVKQYRNDINATNDSQKQSEIASEYFKNAVAQISENDYPVPEFMWEAGIWTYAYATAVVLFLLEKTKDPDRTMRSLVQLGEQQDPRKVDMSGARLTAEQPQRTGNRRQVTEFDGELPVTRYLSPDAPTLSANRPFLFYSGKRDKKISGARLSDLTKHERLVINAELRRYFKQSKAAQKELLSLLKVIFLPLRDEDFSKDLIENQINTHKHTLTELTAKIRQIGIEISYLRQDEELYESLKAGDITDQGMCRQLTYTALDALGKLKIEKKAGVKVEVAQVKEFRPSLGKYGERRVSHRDGNPGQYDERFYQGIEHNYLVLSKGGLSLAIDLAAGQFFPDEASKFLGGVVDHSNSWSQRLIPAIKQNMPRYDPDLFDQFHREQALALGALMSRASGEKKEPKGSDLPLTTSSTFFGTRLAGRELTKTKGSNLALTASPTGTGQATGDLVPGDDSVAAPGARLGGMPAYSGQEAGDRENAGILDTDSSTLTPGANVLSKSPGARLALERFRQQAIDFSTGIPRTLSRKASRRDFAKISILATAAAFLGLRTTVYADVIDEALENLKKDFDVITRDLTNASQTRDQAVDRALGNFETTIRQQLKSRSIDFASAANAIRKVNHIVMPGYVVSTPAVANGLFFMPDNDRFYVLLNVVREETRGNGPRAKKIYFVRQVTPIKGLAFSDMRAGWTDSDIDYLFANEKVIQDHDAEMYAPVLAGETGVSGIDDERAATLFDSLVKAAFSGVSAAERLKIQIQSFVSHEIEHQISFDYARLRGVDQERIDRVVYNNLNLLESMANLRAVIEEEPFHRFSNLLVGMSIGDSSSLDFFRRITEKTEISDILDILEKWTNEKAGGAIRTRAQDAYDRAVIEWKRIVDAGARLSEDAGQATGDLVPGDDSEAALGARLGEISADSGQETGVRNQRTANSEQRTAGRKLTPASSTLAPEANNFDNSSGARLATEKLPHDGKVTRPHAVSKGLDPLNARKTTVSLSQSAKAFLSESRTAVTGASGHLGSLLFHYLLQDSPRVQPLFMQESTDWGAYQGYAFQNKSKAAPVFGALPDRAVQQQIVEDNDVIFHLAGRARISPLSTDAGKSDAELLAAALVDNAYSTQQFVALMAESSHKPVFVYPSSIQVYELMDWKKVNHPLKEDDLVLDAELESWMKQTLSFIRSIRMTDVTRQKLIPEFTNYLVGHPAPKKYTQMWYALSKLVAERLALSYPKSIVLRLAGAYGLGIDETQEDGAIPLINQWMRRAQKGEPIRYMPGQQKNYLWVEDMVRLIENASAVFAEGEPGVERVINVGSHQPITTDQIVGAIVEVYRDKPSTPLPDTAADRSQSRPSMDTRLMVRMLMEGTTDLTLLPDALERYGVWIKNGFDYEGTWVNRIRHVSDAVDSGKVDSGSQVADKDRMQKVLDAAAKIRQVWPIQKVASSIHGSDGRQIAQATNKWGRRHAETQAMIEALRLDLEEKIRQGVVVSDGELIQVALDYLMMPRPYGESESKEYAQLLHWVSVRLGEPLKGSSIYVNMQPCVSCAPVIEAMRITKVVYGFRDPKTLQPDARDDNFRESGIDVVPGVLQAASIRNNWFYLILMSNGHGKLVYRLTEIAEPLVSEWVSNKRWARSRDILREKLETGGLLGGARLAIGTPRDNRNLIRKIKEDLKKINAAHERWRHGLPVVVVIGSARISDKDHPYYKAAFRVGQKLRNQGIIARTGAGPAIMEAASSGNLPKRGSKAPPREWTQGINIKVPWEQAANPYVQDLLTAQNFYTRKKGLFGGYEWGVIAIPGGFGSVDEFFEAWRRGYPIAFYGKEYWRPILDAYISTWSKAGMSDQVNKRGEILLTDSEDEAIQFIKREHKKRGPNGLRRQTIEEELGEIEEGLSWAGYHPSVTFSGTSHRQGELDEAVKLAEKIWLSSKGSSLSLTASSPGTDQVTGAPVPGDGREATPGARLTNSSVLDLAKEPLRYPHTDHREIFLEGSNLSLATSNVPNEATVEGTRLANGNEKTDYKSMVYPSLFRSTSLPLIWAGFVSINSFSTAMSSSVGTGGWIFMMIMPAVLWAGYRIPSVKSLSWVRKILDSATIFLNNSPFLSPLAAVRMSKPNFLSGLMSLKLTSSSARISTAPKSREEGIFPIFQNLGGIMKRSLYVFFSQARVTFQDFFSRLPGLKQLKDYVDRYAGALKAKFSVANIGVGGDVFHGRNYNILAPAGQTGSGARLADSLESRVRRFLADKPDSGRVDAWRYYEWRFRHSVVWALYEPWRFIEMLRFDLAIGRKFSESLKALYLNELSAEDLKAVHRALPRIKKIFRHLSHGAYDAAMLHRLSGGALADYWPQINFKLRFDNGNLILTVIDNGLGMTEEEIGRLLKWKTPAEKKNATHVLKRQMPEQFFGGIGGKMFGTVGMAVFDHVAEWHRDSQIQVITRTQSGDAYKVEKNYIYDEEEGRKRPDGKPVKTEMSKTVKVKNYGQRGTTVEISLSLLPSTKASPDKPITLVSDAHSGFFDENIKKSKLERALEKTMYSKGLRNAAIFMGVVSFMGLPQVGIPVGVSYFFYNTIKNYISDKSAPGRGARLAAAQPHGTGNKVQITQDELPVTRTLFADASTQTPGQAVVRAMKKEGIGLSQSAAAFLRGRSVAVTGAAGHMGTLLFHYLLQDAKEVQPLFMDSAPVRKEYESSDFNGKAKSKPIFSLLPDRKIQKQMVDDNDVIFHMAGRARISPLETDKGLSDEDLLAGALTDNAFTTQVFVDLMQDSERQPVFIYPSSIQVYELIDWKKLRRPVRESDLVLDQDLEKWAREAVDFIKSSSGGDHNREEAIAIMKAFLKIHPAPERYRKLWYALSKLVAERLALSYSRTVVPRMAGAYGLGIDETQEDGAIPLINQWMHHAELGTPINYIPGKNQSKNYVWVEDMVRMIENASILLENQDDGVTAARIINIGSPKNITTSAIIKQIALVVGKDLNVTPDNSADRSRSRPSMDTSLMQELLMSPQEKPTTLKTALSRYLTWQKTGVPYSGTWVNRGARLANGSTEQWWPLALLEQTKAFFGLGSSSWRLTFGKDAPAVSIDPKALELILVRNGETAGNRHGLKKNKGNHLTKQGRRQTDVAVSEIYEAIQPEIEKGSRVMIVSSPIPRAKYMAEKLLRMFSQLPSLRINERSFLAEMSWGDFESVNFRDLKGTQKDEFDKFMNSFLVKLDATATPPGAKDYSTIHLTEVAPKFRQFIDEIEEHYRQTGQRTVVIAVGHGTKFSMIQALLGDLNILNDDGVIDWHAKKLPYASPRRFNPETRRTEPLAGARLADKSKASKGAAIPSGEDLAKRYRELGGDDATAQKMVSAYTRAWEMYANGRKRGVEQRMSSAVSNALTLIEWRADPQVIMASLFYQEDISALKKHYPEGYPIISNVAKVSRVPFEGKVANDRTVPNRMNRELRALSYAEFLLYLSVRYNHILRELNADTDDKVADKWIAELKMLVAQIRRNQGESVRIAEEIEDALVKLKSPDQYERVTSELKQSTSHVGLSELAGLASHMERLLHEGGINAQVYYRIKNLASILEKDRPTNDLYALRVVSDDPFAAEEIMTSWLAKPRSGLFRAKPVMDVGMVDGKAQRDYKTHLRGWWVDMKGTLSPDSQEAISVEIQYTDREFQELNTRGGGTFAHWAYRLFSYTLQKVWWASTKPNFRKQPALTSGDPEANWKAHQNVIGNRIYVSVFRLNEKHEIVWQDTLELPSAAYPLDAAVALDRKDDPATAQFLKVDVAVGHFPNVVFDSETESISLADSDKALENGDVLLEIDKLPSAASLQRRVKGLTKKLSRPILHRSIASALYLAKGDREQWISDGKRTVIAKRGKDVDGQQSAQLRADLEEFADMIGLREGAEDLYAVLGSGLYHGDRWKMDFELFLADRSYLPDMSAEALAHPLPTPYEAVQRVFRVFDAEQKRGASSLSDFVKKAYFNGRSEKGAVITVDGFNERNWQAPTFEDVFLEMHRKVTGVASSKSTKSDRDLFTDSDSAIFHAFATLLFVGHQYFPNQPEDAVRKQGDAIPYSTHPTDLMMILFHRFRSQIDEGESVIGAIALAASLIHDLFEDTLLGQLTDDQILEITGLKGNARAKEAIKMARVMTRRKDTGETDRQYYERLIASIDHEYKENRRYYYAMLAIKMADKLASVYYDLDVVKDKDLDEKVATDIMEFLEGRRAFVKYFANMLLRTENPELQKFAHYFNREYLTVYEKQLQRIGMAPNLRESFILKFMEQRKLYPSSVRYDAGREVWTVKSMLHRGDEVSEYKAVNVEELSDDQFESFWNIIRTAYPPGWEATWLKDPAERKRILREVGSDVSARALFSLDDSGHPTELVGGYIYTLKYSTLDAIAVKEDVRGLGATHALIASLRHEFLDDNHKTKIKVMSLPIYLDTLVDDLFYSSIENEYLEEFLGIGDSAYPAPNLQDPPVGARMAENTGDGSRETGVAEIINPFRLKSQYAGSEQDRRKNIAQILTDLHDSFLMSSGENGSSMTYQNQDPETLLDSLVHYRLRLYWRPLLGNGRGLPIREVAFYDPTQIPNARHGDMIYYRGSEKLIFILNTNQLSTYFNYAVHSNDFNHKNLLRYLHGDELEVYETLTPYRRLDDDSRGIRAADVFTLIKQSLSAIDGIHDAQKSIAWPDLNGNFVTQSPMVVKAFDLFEETWQDRHDAIRRFERMSSRIPMGGYAVLSGAKDMALDSRYFISRGYEVLNTTIPIRYTEGSTGSAKLAQFYVLKKTSDVPPDEPESKSGQTQDTSSDGGESPSIKKDKPGGAPDNVLLFTRAAGARLAAGKPSHVPSLDPVRQRAMMTTLLRHHLGNKLSGNNPATSLYLLNNYFKDAAEAVLYQRTGLDTRSKEILQFLDFLSPDTPHDKRYIFIPAAGSASDLYATPLTQAYGHQFEESYKLSVEEIEALDKVVGFKRLYDLLYPPFKAIAGFAASKDSQDLTDRKFLNQWATLYANARDALESVPNTLKEVDEQEEASLTGSDQPPGHHDTGSPEDAEVRNPRAEDSSSQQAAGSLQQKPEGARMGVVGDQGSEVRGRNSEVGEQTAGDSEQLVAGSRLAIEVYQLPHETVKDYRTRVRDLVKRGFTYEDAQAWRKERIAGDLSHYPHGIWKNEDTAKNFIWVALDTIPGFQKARESSNIKEMANLYRQNIIRYVPKNPKEEPGQQAFFFEVGTVRGLMNAPRPYLKKMGSPASLLQFALPGLIDLKNPDALDPLEVEINYWTEAENAKHHILQALNLLHGFKAAREANNIAEMARIYREKVIRYESINKAKFPSNGQLSYFKEQGSLEVLTTMPRSYLAKRDSAASLVRLALPALIDPANPDALDPQEVEHHYWSNPDNAKYHILRALDTIKGFKEAREVENIPEMAKLYREHVIEYESKDKKKYPRNGQRSFFGEVGGLMGLISGRQDYLDNKTKVAMLLRLVLPKLVDDFNSDALSSDELELQQWDTPETAKKAIIEALDAIPGFQAARTSDDIGTMAALYREHVIGHKPFASEGTNERGGQVAFFKAHGLTGLMHRRRAYLSKSESPASLIRLALPKLIDVSNKDALDPQEVDYAYWVEPDNARYHILKTLDAIQGFQQARESANIEKMAALYREHVIGYMSQDKTHFPSDGQNAFFYEVGGLRGLMGDPRPYFSKSGSSGAVLEFAIPALVDDKNPAALKRAEVYQERTLKTLPDKGGARWTEKNESPGHKVTESHEKTGARSQRTAGSGQEKSEGARLARFDKALGHQSPDTRSAENTEVGGRKSEKNGLSSMVYSLDEPFPLLEFNGARLVTAMAPTPLAEGFMAAVPVPMLVGMGARLRGSPRQSLPFLHEGQVALVGQKNIPPVDAQGARLRQILDDATQSVAQKQIGLENNQVEALQYLISQLGVSADSLQGIIGVDLGKFNMGVLVPALTEFHAHYPRVRFYFFGQPENIAQLSLFPLATPQAWADPNEKRVQLTDESHLLENVGYALLGRVSQNEVIPARSVLHYGALLLGLQNLNAAKAGDVKNSTISILRQLSGNTEAPVSGADILHFAQGRLDAPVLEAARSLMIRAVRMVEAEMMDYIENLQALSQAA